MIRRNFVKSLALVPFVSIPGIANSIQVKQKELSLHNTIFQRVNDITPKLNKRLKQEISNKYGRIISSPFTYTYVHPYPYLGISKQYLLYEIAACIDCQADVFNLSEAYRMYDILFSVLCYKYEEDEAIGYTDIQLFYDPHIYRQRRIGFVAYMSIFGKNSEVINVSPKLS